MSAITPQHLSPEKPGALSGDSDKAQRIKRNYWLYQILGWGAFALIQLYVVSFLDQPLPAEPLLLPWPQALAELLALSCAGLLLSHALRQHIHRKNWRSLPSASLLLRVTGACALLGVLPGIANNLMSVAVVRGGVYDDSLYGFISHIANWGSIFGLWSVLYFSIVRARERRQAELRESELIRALQLAELRVLKAQLNPHFLFNSLNSVRALITDNPAQAQQAITRLSRLLRYTLGASERELVSLDQELAITDDYIELEALRLGARLRVERTIADNSRHIQVPVMLVQTVVENAIKHGIAELREGGLLKVHCQLDDQRDGSVLVIQIENPRPPQADSNAGNGLGLKNGAERLRFLYGDSARLTLDLATPTMATTTIRIPVIA